MLTNTEAEAKVLGCILLEPSLADVAMEGLAEEDFADPENRYIFEHMVKLRSQGRRVVAEGLPLESQVKLSVAENSVATAANVDTWIALVREAGDRRRLAEAGREIQELALNPLDVDQVLALSESKVLSVRRDAGQAVRPIREVAKEVYAQVEALLGGCGPPPWLTSGIGDLDRLLGGLQKTELVIVAARPSMGKSAFLGQVLSHIARSHGPVLWFTLEMSRRQVVNRLAADLADLSLDKITTGSLEESEMYRFHRAIAQIHDLDILIDDSGYLTPALVGSRARKVKQKNLAAIGIDYLQLMHPNPRRRDGSTRDQEVSEMTRACKLLAKELDVPIILLSQLNRACEQRTDKRPVLADLRESGAIEQDANKVLMLYRDEVYNPNTRYIGQCELIVRKNRDGKTGSITVEFDGAKMRFR